MNYRHIYHAGNFADVAKHVGLTYCIGALRRKDTAFFVLDSHAGRGYYDLQAAEAQKSGEAERGIQRLIETSIGTAQLASYFAAIRARRGKRLARYPGSPALIAGGLRPQDRALFVELMPAEARAAEREIDSSGRVRVEISDGYAALKAFLPPDERRGLVLIDPPYEQPDEFERLALALTAAHRKWPTGIYALWYPIKNLRETAAFARRIAASGIARVLRAELTLARADSERLGGSGLIVVNPPWRLEQELSVLMPALAQALGAAPAGATRLDWLVPPI